jgi:hypothetical protein
MTRNIGVMKDTPVILYKIETIFPQKDTFYGERYFSEKKFPKKHTF